LFSNTPAQACGRTRCQEWWTCRWFTPRGHRSLRRQRRRDGPSAGRAVSDGAHGRCLGIRGSTSILGASPLGWIPAGPGSRHHPCPESRRGPASSSHRRKKLMPLTASERQGRSSPPRHPAQRSGSRGPAWWAIVSSEFRLRDFAVRSNVRAHPSPPQEPKVCRLTAGGLEGSGFERSGADGEPSDHTDPDRLHQRGRSSRGGPSRQPPAPGEQSHGFAFSPVNLDPKRLELISELVPKAGLSACSEPPQERDRCSNPAPSSATHDALRRIELRRTFYPSPILSITRSAGQRACASITC